MDKPAKDQTSGTLTTCTNSTDEIAQDINSSSRLPQSKSYIYLPLKPDEKYTIENIRAVDNRTLTDNELTSNDEIPDYIFKTLMIFDYHARGFELKNLTSVKHKHNDSDSDESEDEDLDGLEVNPMDALLGIFHCSEDFLRQYLAIKLSECQLSVPFLLPEPGARSEKVTILLSALKRITKIWSDQDACNENQSVKQVFATEYPFPVVSFIRIGKTTLSKSRLMNKIMSDGNQDHDFFFHKNMKGGNFQRKIVEGSVELSWYLPSGNKRQTLQSEICFANLRGDAKCFKKQLDTLLHISSVLCLLLNSESPDKTVMAILKTLTNSEAKVIIIFNEKRQAETKEYFNDLRKKHKGELSLITCARKSNEYNFHQSIREKIQENIHDVKSKATPLVELTSCVSEYGICLDDYQSNLGLDWIGLGIKEAKNLLKLQMHVPVFADLDREKYSPKRHGNKSKNCIKRDAVEIYKDIQAEREVQQGSRGQLDGRILQFLNRIAVMDKTERNRTLNGIKHQLDKMSLQVTAKLHQEYRVAALNLQKAKIETCQKSDTQSSKEEHLKKLGESISRCSFGLEHIIRELAQLYQLDEHTEYDYAGAAADMLLSGFPLELVDGDSSYIPQRWFTAVYTKLQRKTNDAKIFVISVLGIQSSGKSTMLNTMFGLEFPVSAGRCTRGVFASLIPVSDSLKCASDYDYVLVIDTEGLKASRDPELREHDNELATFVIGVADITIVNIFGENNNEMKEFLEITVHAFLKMKIIKEKRTCKIVHQNVIATDATDKLIVARCKLKQDLDKMAKAAAIQEDCEDKFQKFNDIISFDENKDVFYVPNLLQGSPPMAPVNPGYGRAIQRIKENIVTLMCSKERFQLSVCGFRNRVTNLWEAILKENFIFSFRNTIEVRAYTSLDRKYFQQSVNLMMNMAVLEKEIQVALSRCTTRDERKKKWEVCKIQIRKEAEEQRKKMEIELKIFFETSEDKETLEQWKENVMNKIQQLKENQQMEATKNGLATVLYWQNRQDVDEMKQTCEKELLQKAKTFITSAHHADDTEKCKAAFEQKWQQWILDVPQCQETEIDVNNEMVDVLCDTEQALNAEMSEKLKENDFWILKFRDILPVINTELSTTWYHNTFSSFSSDHHRQILLSVKTIIRLAVAAALDFAKMRSELGVRCTRNDLTQMYDKVISTIDKEKKQYHCKFGKSLKCEILLYSFANAYKIFYEMEERYIQEQDIRGQLERNMKPRLETYFLNLCSEMGKDVLASTSIVDVLQNPIESALNSTMGPAVTAKLLTNSLYQSKGPFHASVLIQLGEERKFESYIPYLENPVGFLRKKLMQSIEDYYLEQEPASITLLLKREAEKIKDKVFAAILTASKQTKSRNGKLTFWIQQFVENCSTLAITKEMFAIAAIDEDLKDIDVFEAKVRENVGQFLESLVERGVDRATFKKWNPSPHEQMCKSMFGCKKLCPFCRSLCDQTEEDHAGFHCSKIHRPNGLTGYSYRDTKVLGLMICTNAVASEERFLNASTLGKWHQFKDYQSVNDYYKSWSIPPDKSFEASTYWQWFMATFSEELAKHYHAKEPDIPVAWKNRTFREVKDQLRQEYNM